ncbi:MAG: transglycosylase SLT domain-containing protein [Bacteroidota bacterium]
MKVWNSLIIIFLLLIIGGLLTFIIWQNLHKESKIAAATKTAPPWQVFPYPFPQDLDFAGEKVPLESPRISEKMDLALTNNVYRHSNTIIRYKRVTRWFPMIEKVLAENDIPDDFKYLAVIESNLDNLVSYQGAAGFWQFMPATAQEYGLEVNGYVDERFHPKKATEAAAKYLKEAYKKFKNWTLVAASYNRGMKGIQDKLEQQQVKSYYDLHLNLETAQYVYKILAVKHLYTHLQDYGYQIAEQQRYLPRSTQALTIHESIPDLIGFAKEKGTNLAEIKDLNPWLMQNILPVNQANKTYQLLIPNASIQKSQK